MSKDSHPLSASLYVVVNVLITRESELVFDRITRLEALRNPEMAHQIEVTGRRDGTTQVRRTARV
ncbi:MAG: hypothetical protein L0Y54_23645, partial [Sporichthyaceae bacterium]|nr:hypothetical protein [Sporichthyaceae bacterium]